MNTTAWGIVAHSHESQRQQLTSVLQQMKLFTQSAPQLSDLISLQAPLGSIWIIFDPAQDTQGAIDRAYIEQIRQNQVSVFWGILVIGQAAEQDKQEWIDAGVDTYLSYPFDRTNLLKQIRTILDKRTPLSHYQVLPAPLAQALDKVSIRLDQLNYYKLLEVDQHVEADSLQQRFHQRSLLLHPDRHRTIKQTHPSVYNKVNEIYKRVLEAYRVLSNPMKRAMYDAMLPQNHLRWSVQSDRQLRALLKLSESTEVQSLLAKVMSYRSQGQLVLAYQHVVHALQHEPNNQALQSFYKNYHRLLQLIADDSTLIALLPSEFSA